MRLASALFVDPKRRGRTARALSSHAQILLKVVTCAAATLMGATASAAQPEEFRNVLLTQAAFTADEFSALERGRVVVKLLPATDKREVAFCGVLRMRGTPATLLTAFKESLTQKNKLAVLGGGAISSLPALEDLQALTLEKLDVEEMRRCAVGNCKVKMSNEMIGRLQSEVDWAASDCRLQATKLFRQMLSDYVRAYLARGDAALVEYNDGAGDTVRPDEEQRSLLNSLPYVNDSAPEFASYLQNFPRLELSGVENSLHWSRIKLGLKPVVIITHTATYTRRRDDAPQILVATKQLYANHYFDSSLSLTLLTGVPSSGADSDTYLLYANRSRTDALDGLFGGFTRGLIEREVLDGLRTTLQQTKLNVEIRLANQSGAAPQADDEAAATRPWAQRLSWGARHFFLALLIIASILFVWLGKRAQERAARER